MSKTSHGSVALSQSYVEALKFGDRAASRQLIEASLTCGQSAQGLLNELIWPTMEFLQTLYREDRINAATLNLATRLNRSMTEQIATKLERKASNGKSALIFCGAAEPEELGGQIAAELFEADGYTVRFGGGGVPHDEVLKLIGETRPNLLILFATLPSGIPDVRKLIDWLKTVNSCPDMQIMCCGGIYKRAEGLADEIGADLYAPDASTAVKTANENPTKRATLEQQTVGRTRREKKAQARRSSKAVRPQSVVPQNIPINRAA